MSIAREVPTRPTERMLDARARGLLLSMLLGHGLMETPPGRRIADAIDTAMDAAVLPFIVTADEADAVRAVATAASGATDIRLAQRRLASQLGDPVGVSTQVVRASVGALRRLWLHHVGLTDADSLTLCSVVERSGALQVGVFTSIADTDVVTIVQALPLQASIMFQTLLGDRPVEGTD